MTFRDLSVGSGETPFQRHRWLQATVWIPCCIGGSQISTGDSSPCHWSTLSLLSLLSHIGESSAVCGFLLRLIGASLMLP
ncbi:hypothetical protein HAX54_050844, partial [Datura stramonium]|nr:hypothetical protein [Datura stramonium]